jgi:hypothetical protein
VSKAHPGGAPADEHVVAVRGWTHGVRFYQSDRELISTVAGYAADVWSAGGSCLVIATPAHRTALRRRLAPQLWSATGEERRLIELDAAETLASFMRAGTPDATLFAGSVGALVRQLAQSAPLGAFGEMVDVLWAEGNAVAALQLEELWADLQREVPFTLLCSYASSHLRPRQRQTVSAAHDHVLP